MGVLVLYLTCLGHFGPEFGVHMFQETLSEAKKMVQECMSIVLGRDVEDMAA